MLIIAVRDGQCCRALTYQKMRRPYQTTYMITPRAFAVEANGHGWQYYLPARTPDQRRSLPAGLGGAGTRHW